LQGGGRDEAAARDGAPDGGRASLARGKGGGADTKPSRAPKKGGGGAHTEMEDPMEFSNRLVSYNVLDFEITR
jgi:hypothetical protein